MVRRRQVESARGTWVLAAWLVSAACAAVAGCGSKAPTTPAAAAPHGDVAKPGAAPASSSPPAATGEPSSNRPPDPPAPVPEPTSSPPAAAAAPAAAVQAGAGGDWPRFRGPSGQGIAAGELPLTWSATENLAWKTKLPGPGASSPIVFGDRVYLTCYSGYLVPGEAEGSLEQLQRHLLAMSRKDGQILWDQAEPAKLPEEARIRDHGFAANTPVADAERVYVFHGKSGVFAYDHAGQKQWQADVGGQTHGWGSAASLVLHQDLLLVNASVESGALVALDRRTGEEKWRARGINEAWNTPLIAAAAGGREELIVAIQGKILAFDPAGGQPLWSCKTDIGWYMVPSVVAADGIVYALGGRSGVASLAVRQGGEGEVTATHRLWTSQKGSNVASPVFHQGKLYWMNEHEFAFCADAATGEIVYQERVPRADQVYASGVLAGGRLYYLNRQGKTFVVAAKPEFELLATNDLSDRSVFNGTPAPDGNRLLIRSDKFLYCIGN